MTADLYIHDTDIIEEAEVISSSPKNTSRYRSFMNRVRVMASSLFSMQDTHSYDKYNDDISQAGLQTLKNTGGYRKPEDYLLTADFEKYGKAKYQLATYLFHDAPADFKFLPTYNSVLPDADRSSPGLLGFRAFNKSHDRELFDNVNEGSIKATKTYMLIMMSILGLIMLSSVLVMPWPASSIFGDPVNAQYLSTGQWLREGFVGVVAWLLQGIASLGLLSIACIAGTYCMFQFVVRPAVRYVYEFTFFNHMNTTWHSLKNQLTYELTGPTRDGRHKSKEDTKSFLRELKAVNRAFEAAATYLKDQPLLRLGTYEGISADKGVNYSPMKGSPWIIDMSSLRMHFLGLGDSGARKTTGALLPLITQFLQAGYDTRHTSGALIMDGKGVLGNQVLDFLPPHLRRNVYVCSTDEGGYGIDLLKSLTPNEFAEQFLIAAFAIAKSPESGKWISGAADRVRDAGEILYLAMTRPDILDLSDEWKDRGYSYYSMMGINALTTEVELRATVTKLILEKSDVMPADVVTAARNFQTFEGLAADTKTSYTSNITDVFSKITGKLALRFGYGGNVKNEKFVDLEKLDEGALIAMAISAADDQQGGIVINNIVKAVAYMLAQKRDTSANRARMKIERIDEFIKGDTPKALQNLYFKLTNTKGGLTSGDEVRVASALQNMDILYARKVQKGEAAWSTYTIAEIVKFIDQRIDETNRELARYTNEIKKIAEGVISARNVAANDNLSRPMEDWIDVTKVGSPAYDKLKEERDATSKTSVMILVDEAHFFVSGGNSNTSDTFFSSIARSTGRILVFAVQSYDSLLTKLSEAEASTLMANFNTKLILRTKNPRTQEYVSQQFGQTNSETVAAKNGFSNFSRLLDKSGFNHSPMIKTSAANNGFRMNMNSSIRYHDALSCPIRDYQAGERDNVHARQHEDNVAAAVNETHKNIIEYQKYQEDTDKSGTLTPVVSTTDVMGQGLSQAYIIMNRAGLTIRDQVDLIYGSDDDVEEEFRDIPVAA